MKKGNLLKGFVGVKALGIKGLVGAKGMKYMLRHPVKSTRNMLALRGAKSLATSRGAAVTAAVATAAVAVPLAVRAVRGSEET